MTDAITLPKSVVLLGRLSKLITEQTAGKPSGFTSEELNHAYMSLVEGHVSEDTAALLSNILGEDWHEGWEPSESEEDAEADAFNAALTETLEEIDVVDPKDAVSTLASALMIACRELGWLEASRAAHDQWFYSSKVTYTV